MGDFSYHGRRKPEWKQWKRVTRNGKRWTYMYTEIQMGPHYYQLDDSWVDEWFSDEERKHILEYRTESYLYYGEGTDMCVEHTIVMDISKECFMHGDGAGTESGSASVGGKRHKKKQQQTLMVSAGDEKCMT